VQNGRKTDVGSQSLPVESAVEQSARRTAAIVFADIHVAAQSGGATLLDVTHDVQMLNGKRVIFPVLFSMSPEDVGNFQLKAMAVRDLLGR
jgi:hypothetical protein